MLFIGLPAARIDAVVFVIATALMWGIVRSPWGRAFKALRENPVRAESLGLDTRRITLLAFAIGSAYGGLAGTMVTPLVQFIEPGSFALIHSIRILLMVVVGAPAISGRTSARRW